MNCSLKYKIKWICIHFIQMIWKKSFLSFFLKTSIRGKNLNKKTCEKLTILWFFSNSKFRKKDDVMLVIVWYRHIKMNISIYTYGSNDNQNYIISRSCNFLPKTLCFFVQTKPIFVFYSTNTAARTNKWTARVLK